MSENDKPLSKGGPLLIEDLDVTMNVVTYQGAANYGFFMRVWKNLTCRHEFGEKVPDMWFTPYCHKCGLIRRKNG